MCLFIKLQSLLKETMWPSINFSEREVVHLAFSYDDKDFDFHFDVVLAILVPTTNNNEYNFRRKDYKHNTYL